MQHLIAKNRPLSGFTVLSKATEPYCGNFVGYHGLEMAVTGLAAPPKLSGRPGR